MTNVTRRSASACGRFHVRHRRSSMGKRGDRSPSALRGGELADHPPRPVERTEWSEIACGVPRENTIRPPHSRSNGASMGCVGIESRLTRMGIEASSSHAPASSSMGMFCSSRPSSSRFCRKKSNDAVWRPLSGNVLGPRIRRTHRVLHCPSRWRYGPPHGRLLVRERPRAKLVIAVVEQRELSGEERRRYLPSSRKHLR